MIALATELQRGDRHAASAKRCCVSEERKTNDGKVRISHLDASRSELTLPADFVEKLRNSNISIFGQKPIIPRSQMRSFVRRRELAHERQKARLAEPLATKSLSACMAKKFADLSKKRSFSTQSAHNDRPKTRPAVCIEFCYQLKLRKGRLPENANTLKLLHFLNAPF